MANPSWYSGEICVAPRCSCKIIIWTFSLFCFPALPTIFCYLVECEMVGFLITEKTLPGGGLIEGEKTK